MKHKFILLALIWGYVVGAVMMGLILVPEVLSDPTPATSCNTASTETKLDVIDSKLTALMMANGYHPEN